MASRLVASLPVPAARAWWRSWVGASDNRKIFGALLVTGILLGGAKLAAVAKDLLVAASFGTSDDLDAFFIALLLPNLLMGLVAGSLYAALIPTYVEVRDRDGLDAAQRLLSGIILLGSLLFVAIAVLFAFVGPYLLPLLALGFDSAKLELTIHLYLMLLPIVVVAGLAKIWSAVLNAGERFALTAWSEVAVPIVTVVVLLLLRNRIGIYALPTGFVTGMFAYLCLLGWGLNRQGASVRPRWYGFTRAIRQVMGQYLPLCAGALALASTPLVDQAMAATLGSGSVATLTFGARIIDPLLNLGAAALTTAVLPHCSRMVVAENWPAVRRTLRLYTVLILVGTGAVTLLLFVFSQDLIRLLFERGAFTAADTHAVSSVQIMYALQIPFYAVTILFVRLVSSLKGNHILMFGAVISAVSNIILSYLFKMQFGLVGIALATSVVAVLTLVFTTIMLYRLLRQREASCGSPS